MGRKYTWAYINTTAEGDVAPAEGEFGSIQTKDFDGGFKGHANFRYLTSSTTPPTSPLTTHVVKLTGDLEMSGDIHCTGSIYARNYYIKNVGFMDLTGSTKFGDSLDDTHDIRGDVTLNDDSTLYFNAEAGSDNIVASSAGHLEINAGSTLDITAPTVHVNSATTVDIDAVAFDLDATTSVAIDCASTSNGISIGTATSAVPISIGHTTSETTVNDNLTVTGILSASHATITGESTFNDHVKINQDDGQKGLHIDQTGDEVALYITSDQDRSNVRIIPTNLTDEAGIRIDTEGITGGDGIKIADNGTGTMTDGHMLYVHSTSTTTNNRQLVYIKNESTAATGAQCLKVVQEASDVNAFNFEGPDGNILKGSDKGVIIGVAATSLDSALHVRSASDTTAPRIKINAGNTAAQRDPSVHFYNDGVAKFNVGTDGSDSDTFKISAGAAVGTNTVFEANTSGELIKLGDDTPSTNEVLTWDGNKAVWAPDAGGTATAVTATSGDVVITAEDGVKVYLDSNDGAAATKFQIYESSQDPLQRVFQVSEQGQARIWNPEGSDEGAVLVLSSSVTDNRLTGIYMDHTRTGNYSGGDNLGALIFRAQENRDAQSQGGRVAYWLTEVADGWAHDQSAETWVSGSNHGTQIKFANVSVGSTTLTDRLIIDGAGVVVNGRIYGPVDADLNIKSDLNINATIDADNDGGTAEFVIKNGAGTDLFKVNQDGEIWGKDADHLKIRSDKAIHLFLDEDDGGDGEDGDHTFRVYNGSDTILIEAQETGDFLVGGGFGSTGVTISNAGAISADGQLTLQNTLNAAGDIDDPNDYALLLHNNSSNNSTGPGIAFQATSNADQVGAAIIHEKTAEYSKGHLKFYTKQANTDGTAPELVMTMTHNGNVEVENALYIGGGFGDTGVTINADGDIEANGYLKAGGGFGASGVSLSTNGAISADGQLTLQNTLDALGDVGDADDYAILVHHNSSDNNKGPGIAFQATNNASQVGAAIIHEKTDSYSKGHLHFYTKQANTEDTAPVRAMSLTDSGNLVVGDEPDHESGKVTIYDTTLDALADVGVPANYHLALKRHATDNTTGPGISFASTDADDLVGAAIIHKRTASDSKGNLEFYTKQDTGTVDPVLVMELTDAGTAEFGGGFGSTGMTIYSNGDFSANGTGTVTKLDVGGGYGSSGATIYANGGINTDGNLRVDGTILAAGGIAPLANNDLNIKADQRIYFDCDDDADDSTDPAGFYFRNGEDATMFSVTSGSADGDVWCQIGQNAYDTAALVMNAKASYISIFSKDSSANLNLIGPGNAISKDETISQTRIWGQETDSGTTGNCGTIQVVAASSTWSANSDMPTNMYFKVGCDGQNSAKQAMSISGHASTPRVGIGQSNTYPVTQLSVRQESDGNSATGARSGISIIDSGANGAWALHIDTGDLLQFTYSDDLFDTIETAGGYLSKITDVLAINFTGQHRNYGDAELYASSSVGLIVCSTGKIKNLDLSTTATINEALPELSLSTQDSDKRVFGVISDSEDENDNQRNHQMGAWGSKFEKEDNRLIVNSVGEGAVWVCDINGNLDNGDYITTCTVPGHGALQADDLLHNYTVAKITQDCTFDLDSTEYVCEEYEHNGTTYKRAFVGCTYHCG